MGTEDLCVHQLVEEQARRTPQRIAVEHASRSLTYSALDDWAECLATDLRDHGVAPDVVVALVAETSAAAIAAVLGILKAGGAYLPVDPHHPSDRSRFVMGDADAAIVVADGGLSVAAELPVLVLHADPVAAPGPDSAGGLVADSTAPRRLRREPTADNLAYVMFTSGSTGRPKGVAMAHRALVNMLRMQLDSYPTAARTLQFAPMGFDVSVQEVFCTLASGGTLVLAPPEIRADGGRLAQLLVDARVERIFMPYVALNELAIACADLPVKPPLREVFTAGEALRVTPAIERLFAETGAGLENQYGPTETHVATRERLSGPPAIWPRLPAIGCPIPGVRVHILDALRREVLVGDTGELYLGGVALARGYANRPALTAERFIPDPFSGEHGARLYATGDLVCALPDGRLEFLGRTDDQVKIRGHRVELGEIEQVLASHPAVAGCAVVAPVGEHGMRRLVAHIVVHAQAPSAGELRTYLATRLPEAMVPASFQLAERLPRTSTGKLDRRALESIVDRPLPGRPTPVAPRNELERQLSTVWTETLGSPVSDVSATLIDLGGDSLTAGRIAARVRVRLGADIDAAAVLSAGSIARLAAQVRALVGSSPTAAAMTPKPRPLLLPLSSAQRRFWLFDQLNPGNPAYNISWHLDLAGPLDHAALRRSLVEVVARHEVMRTTFNMVGEEPVQVVTDEVAVDLPELDLSHLPESEQADAVTRLALEDRNRSFDLRTGPLMRTRLVRLRPDRHRLVATLHHIITDRWSLDVLHDELRTLLTAYSAGLSSPLAPPTLQYADHALLERERISDDQLAPHLQHWARRLDGLTGTLDLPTDHPRTATPTFDSGTVGVTFDPALTADVMELAREMAVTPFAVLLAAFGVLLSRCTGVLDLCVGSPTSGRDLVEQERMLGCFLNTVPLRFNLRDQPTFSDAVRRAQQTVLDAMAHQAVPFETLVERLPMARDPMRPPLTQVMFVFDGVEPVTSGAHSTATVRSPNADQGTGVYDLTLWLGVTDQRLTGALLYRSELFEHERITVMAGHLEVLLRAAVSAPETPVARIPLLTEAERTRIVRKWNATTRRTSPHLVHEQFAMRAAARPDAIALVAGDRTMTYGQLLRRSERLAAHLHRQGVGPEQLVAICTSDGFDLIAAIFGVLSAGGAFLLIDPAYPQERIAYMLADAAPAIALAGRALLDGLAPASCRVTALDDRSVELDAELDTARSAGPRDGGLRHGNLAYVVYTSGSTGRPKGIQIGHAGLTNLTAEKRRWLGIETDSRVVRFASPSFDAAVAEVFQTMTAGATLVISPRERVMPGPEFTDDCRNAAATVLTMPPSVLAQLEPADLPSLTTVMVAGEACTASVAQQWLAGGRRVLNCYGPSEATVATTVCVCDPADLPPPIGRPIANMRVYIVDRELQLMPPGYVGELAIGGVGVARGYLHQPALTAERFVPDPFSGEPGARLYLTGDLASWRRDGNVDYHGRADRQVKVRGVRVELGEIEETLGRHPLVKECAVIVRSPAGSDIQLVACVVLTRPEEGVGELRGAARAWLPPPMVPSAFVVLDRLPLSPHGKVDRGLLAASATEGFDDPLPTVTRTERLVARVWQTVLATHRPVGRDTNFFDIGGHSLLVMRVVNRLRDELGVQVPMRALFEAPILESFAELVEQLGGQIALIRSQPVDDTPVRRQHRRDALPMSYFQEWRFRADEGSQVPLYHVTLGFELTGALNLTVLREAIDELVRRHEPLRTNYDIIDSRPLQVIHPPGSPDLPVADLRRLPEAESKPAALRLLTAEAARPIDRRTSVMFQPFLARFADDRHLLLLRSDRVAIDGAACRLVTDELSSLYACALAGTAPDDDPAAIQQADWASWQRNQLQAHRLEKLVAYWRGKLDGSRPLLELPLPNGLAAPARQTRRGRWTNLNLGTDLSRELRRRARESDVTLFIYVLAALKAFIARLVGLTEATVVCPFGNRTRRELERVVGCFAHGVIYRTDLSGDPSFADAVTRVRDVCFEAWEHQQLPMSEVARHIRPSSYLTLLDEFHVFFDVLREQPQLRLPELAVTPVSVDTGVGHPSLAVFLDDGAENLELLVRADADRFDNSALEWIIQQLGDLVATAVRNPAARIALLPPAPEIVRQRFGTR